MTPYDELMGALIGLAKSCQSHKKTENTDKIIKESLKRSKEHDLESLIQMVKEEKKKVAPNCQSCAMPCGDTDDYDMTKLWEEKDLKKKELKLQILEQIQRVDYSDTELYYKSLCMVGYDFENEFLENLVKELTSCEDL
ncbi:hypothetical protein P261_02828 [Lachnospiraceae bacterium TWA4]|nr:hypothetical protein P261_02828 [Lachnospiraceae bacterium TWA4]